MASSNKLPPLDSIDPERRVLRSAVLVALCCLLSVVIFQGLHQPTLIGWAAFAALAFTQIDTLDAPRSRIPYLLVAIVIFASLAWIGITLGRYPLWFWLSIPPIIFACGSTLALGPRYFNAGAWAAFLYVAFGSTLTTHAFALQVALTFLGVGLLCLTISLLFFPERPERRLARLRVKVLHHCYQNTPQAESLLALHNQLLTQQTSTSSCNTEQQTQQWQWHKAVYQLLLLRRQLPHLRAEAQQHASFAQTQLAHIATQTQHIFDDLLTVNAIQLQELTSKIDSFSAQQRQAIQAVQTQIALSSGDAQAILDYSNYLYHSIQVWHLLATLAQLRLQLRGGHTS